jgi:hypothetical protein
MKNSTMMLMLALGISNAAIQADDNSNFNEKVKNTANKLRNSAYNSTDWFEQYRTACAHNLTDWAEHSRITAQNDAEALESFIIDENHPAFTSLTKAEQKAVRDINKFYRDMASATRKQQDVLVRTFAKRWKACQHIFNKTANKVADQAQSFKDEMKEFTEKLNNSAPTSLADWAEYYTHACAHELSEWVSYHRNIAQDDVNTFESFIQNEESSAFQDLNEDKQQAIKDLNNFYKHMTQANKEEQDKLVREFSTRWKECQRIFHKNN